LDNVWLNFKSGPVLTLKNARNIQLSQLTTATTPGLFVQASGTRTENIKLLKADVSRAKKDVELSSDVKPGAIAIH
jgi:hypothetical protein